MIELYQIPAALPEKIDPARPIVVIDIFRASTSMAAALAAGAEALIFAGSIKEAQDIKNSYGESLVMAGERNGYRIDGYDLGNSPLEMKTEIVGGKTVLFNSTNGTKLLRRFSEFNHVIMASFVTLTAAIDYLKKFDAEPVICCAGTNGKYSTEDVLAGGMIVSGLNRSDLDKDDAARDAEKCIKMAGDDWPEWAANSYHGRYLASIGMGEDVKFCVTRDQFDFVPVLKGNRMIKEL